MGSPSVHDAPEAATPTEIVAAAPTVALGPSRGQKSAAHLRTAGSALVNWWRAVTIEGLCVGLLWLTGLLLLHVPLAPVWAPLLNKWHLFDNLGDATAFADVTEQRVPEHAPFFAYGIYQLG